MNKKVSFGTKPKTKDKIQDIESWVKDGNISSSTEKIETVRFTIDIPVKLHAKIKYKCALKKVKMKDEIQQLLEKHFN